MSFSNNKRGQKSSPEDAAATPYRHANFWISEESKLLINPRSAAEDESFYFDAFARSSEYPGHLWIPSSGSHSKKLIGLSKRAFLISAQAVNEHLHSGGFDRWGLCLPEFHVGGLSIWARAYLSRAHVIPLNENWSAERAYQWLSDNHITLVSLVPTQLFDLVHLDRPAPLSLRAVVIGGAALTPSLYRQARMLGWPILPSFGMTEMGSQIATADLATVEEAPIDVPPLRILKHIQARTDEMGKLSIQSAALMTGFWEMDRKAPVFRPLQKGEWFTTQDRVEIEGEYLFPKGRDADFVKVKGEGVYLKAIEDRLCESHYVRGTIIALPDERDGHRLIFVVEGSDLLARRAVEAWNQSAFPPERVSEIRVVDKIPRSELGKVLKNDLFNLIKQ